MQIGDDATGLSFKKITPKKIRTNSIRPCFPKHPLILATCSDSPERLLCALPVVPIPDVTGVLRYNGAGQEARLINIIYYATADALQRALNSNLAHGMALASPVAGDCFPNPFLLQLLLQLQRLGLERSNLEMAKCVHDDRSGRRFTNLQSLIVCRQGLESDKSAKTKLSDFSVEERDGINEREFVAIH